MSKFNHIVKITVFALGIAIFGLAPAAQARSDRDNHRNHDRYDNYGKKYYNKQRRNHRKNYRNNRHNYNYSNYGYRDNRYYNNRHRRHGNDNLIGGMLAGGLLFYALTANQKKNDTVYVQQQPVYTQQPSQQQWTQAPAQPVTDRSCLQIREYQTTITVGGQTVPAYGQSCLQADGSWKLGPAIAEPNY